MDPGRRRLGPWGPEPGCPVLPWSLRPPPWVSPWADAPGCPWNQASVPMYFWRIRKGFQDAVVRPCSCRLDLCSQGHHGLFLCGWVFLACRRPSLELCAVAVGLEPLLIVLAGQNSRGPGLELGSWFPRAPPWQGQPGGLGLKLWQHMGPAVRSQGAG